MNILEIHVSNITSDTICENVSDGRHVRYHKLIADKNCYGAKETVSLGEFQQSMKGIYTTSVNTSTLDESPMVYKPMGEIVANIEDTVEILKIIKPIYNFKAAE